MTGTVVRVARHRALERLRDCVGLQGSEEAMTDTRCPAPIGFADVVDYWAGDLTRADEDRIEEHVFACADCARELAAAEALARGIAAVAREGRLHSVVTDAILNRLAADGVRVRMFTLEGDRDRAVRGVGRRRSRRGADSGRLRRRWIRSPS